MKDKNGKTIKAGAYVRTPEGISRVSAVIDAVEVTHSSVVEVLSAKEAKASKAQDGDSIIWGS
jgi:uracil phosphoribosyltransferase